MDRDRLTDIHRPEFGPAIDMTPGVVDRTQEMLQEMTRIRLRDELARGCEAWALAPMAKVMNERGMTKLRVFRVALLSDTAYTVH